MRKTGDGEEALQAGDDCCEVAAGGVSARPRHVDGGCDSAVGKNKHERRPDITLFVNGPLLGVIELRDPAEEQDATIWIA